MNRAFSKEKSANGEKTHEEMFNILGHEENANQNHVKIPPHSCQNGYYQEHKQQQSLVRMWKKKETLIHCLWKCKLVQPLWSTIWRLLKTLKIELLYDPAIPLVRIYPKTFESGYDKGRSTFIYSYTIETAKMPYY
jgi:hypothetical protein